MAGAACERGAVHHPGRDQRPGRRHGRSAVGGAAAARGGRHDADAVRLAVALSSRDDAEVKVFLMGDAVTCAVAGQKAPDGHYSLDRMMLKGFLRHGGQIACCGTYLDARGLTEDNLIGNAPRSSMEELAAWTVEADDVLTF